MYVNENITLPIFDRRYFLVGSQCTVVSSPIGTELNVKIRI